MQITDTIGMIRLVGRHPGWEIEPNAVQGDSMLLRTAVVLLLALLASGCGNQSGDSDAQYAERMAQQHKSDQPTPSPAAQADAASPIRSQTVRYATVNGKEV